jgi:predicted ATP-binding protein involved in virulence
MATPKRQVKKKAKTRTPVYFLSLTIENVRCFGEKQTLDLSDGNGRPQQWTIILGDNGVGKTTLLQSLVSITPSEDELEYESGEYMEVSTPKYSVDYKFAQEWEPSRASKKIFKIIGNFSANLLLKEQTSKPLKEELYYEHLEWPRRISCGSRSLSDMVCLGYGAARRMSEITISDNRSADSSASLFFDNAALFNAEEWLLQADYSAHFPSLIQQRARKQRDQVKEILTTLLPEVTDIKLIPPSPEKMLPQVRVKTPYGWVSIKDLSLGYKTLIAWMVDFARRMFELYPDATKPLEQPAVVLVDEIDLHLHPKLQRELMSRLGKIFPNTQFIATAHSPLVVQAATNANIVLLRREGDQVIIDNNPQTIKGWRVDQILTSDLFGLESSRPPQYDDLLEERKKILSKARLTKRDKQRLNELEHKMPLPTGETPQDIAAMDIIRRAAERLKKENNKPHQ